MKNDINFYRDVWSDRIERLETTVSLDQPVSGELTFATLTWILSVSTIVACIAVVCCLIGVVSKLCRDDVAITHRVTAILSLTISGVAILLLPFDILMSFVSGPASIERAQNTVNVKGPDVLFHFWRAIYWIGFTLTWFIYPFTKQFHNSGELVTARRWRSSLRRTGRDVFFLFSIAITCLVLILSFGVVDTDNQSSIASVFRKETTPLSAVSKLSYVIIAICNTYGLLLIAFYLSTGIVSLPMYLWDYNHKRLSLLEASYREVYRLHELWLQADFNLDSLHNEFLAVERTAASLPAMAPSRPPASELMDRSAHGRFQRANDSSASAILIDSNQVASNTVHQYAPLYPVFLEQMSALFPQRLRSRQESYSRPSIPPTNDRGRNVIATETGTSGGWGSCWSKLRQAFFYMRNLAELEEHAVYSDMVRINFRLKNMTNYYNRLKTKQDYMLAKCMRLENELLGTLETVGSSNSEPRDGSITSLIGTSVLVKGFRCMYNCVLQIISRRNSVPRSTTKVSFQMRCLLYSTVILSILVILFEASAFSRYSAGRLTSNLLDRAVDSCVRQPAVSTLTTSEPLFSSTPFDSTAPTSTPLTTYSTTDSSSYSTTAVSSGAVESSSSVVQPSTTMSAESSRNEGVALIDSFFNDLMNGFKMLQGLRVLAVLTVLFIVTIFVVYVVICNYWWLTNISVEFGYYGIQSTDTNTLLYSSSCIISIIFVLMYHIIRLLGLSHTSFQSFYGNIVILPLFGWGVHIYMPIFIFLLIAIKLCNLYDKAIKVFGLSELFSYLYNEDFLEDDEGTEEFGMSRDRSVAEGRRLVTSERLKRQTLQPRGRRITAFS